MTMFVSPGQHDDRRLVTKLLFGNAPSGNSVSRNGVSGHGSQTGVWEPESGEPENREAFTLVELLVVLALLLVLATLSVMFIPNLEGEERAARGGTVLQSWLNIAKQRALRDEAPRGLRLYPSAQALAVDSDTFAVEAQFIDQPDDFVGQPTTSSSNGVLLWGSGTNVTINGADLYGGQTQQSLWLVQQGDYLEILGTGLVHQIANVPSSNTLVLSSNLPFSISQTHPTSNFRIIRAPRPSGEEKLLLPANIGIDLSTNGNFGMPLSFNADNTMDILFSPSGNVIGSQTGTDRVILWVRDFTIPITQGEPTLIVTFTRSGLVAAVPVDPSNGFTTPYTFTTSP